MGRNLNRLDNTDTGMDMDTDNTDMDTDNTDTDLDNTDTDTDTANTNTNTFETDIRLLETMTLISPSMKNSRKNGDLKNSNTYDEIKGNEDIDTPVIRDSPKAYCSFLDIVVPKLSYNNIIQNSTVLDKGTVRGGHAVLKGENDPIDIDTKDGSYAEDFTNRKTKSVLTLGDGDLSFSASLITLIQDRDKDEGVLKDSQLNIRNDRNLKIESINIDLTVSVYESSDSLISKYSNAASNIKFINAIGGRVEGRASSKGAGRSRGRVGGRGRGRGRENYSYKRKEQNEEDIKMNEILNNRLTTTREFTTRILYNLDATVLEAADFDRSNNRNNINRTSDNINMKNDDVKGFDDIGTGEPSLGAEERSARPEESNMNGFDIIIFNFPFGDAIDPSSGYSTANMTPPTANSNPDDLNTGYPRGLGAEYPVNADMTSLKSTIPISDTKKQSIKINDKKVKSSAFDTHFVARGRHKNLISGVFKSAKKILKPKNIGFEDEPNIMITLLLSQVFMYMYIFINDYS
jgi:hypothetical protein